MAIGQLFSQRVGYAVHALCYMAKKGPHNGIITAPELYDWMQASWPGISETYLGTVIRRLVRGGILFSQRGVCGGYGFARSPEAITLRDVVDLLEGFSYARCALTPTGQCAVQNRCQNYRTLCTLQKQYTNLLAGVTIEQLAQDMAAEVPLSIPLKKRNASHEKRNASHLTPCHQPPLAVVMDDTD